MRRFTLLALIVLLATAPVTHAQETPEFPKPDKNHKWLQQLTGEWDAVGEMFVGEGKPPIKSQGTETVRSLGGFWTLGEYKSEVFGQQFIGMLTLGYDTGKKQFVGTWIDSMTGHLWSYQGHLDESGKTLTLRTEGPCPDQPGDLSQFKEVIELNGPDEKTFTSYVQQPDGEWKMMMRIAYTRKK